ncbi:MAG: chemotaxis protein CheA [Desulfuromonadales bacterium]|nr:chemotaxis protein CheA [Desulfuromonadales bacterium]
MDMSKYHDLFLTETGEHLRRMSRLTLALEKEPADRNGIDALFREAHSIKGMAASMGFDATARLAHHLEDLLAGFRDAGTVPAQGVDLLLSGVDLLEGLLADITAGVAERDVSILIAAPIEAAVAVAVSVEEDRSDSPIEPVTELLQRVQVVIDLTADALAPSARALLILNALGSAGQVEACKPTIAEIQQGFPVRQLSVWLKSHCSEEEISRTLHGMADIKQVSFQLDRRKSSLRDDDSRTVRVRTALFDQFINLTGELITNRYMLQSAARAGDWQEIKEGLSLLTRLVGDLHHHVLQVRMTPLESITANLPRLVRDHCRKTGKTVNLEISGEGLELDRTILEALSDPLVHMVRNAVDHAIEKQGTISIKAWREKDMAMIEIADDGRGIDPEMIRGKLVERGLLKESQAAELSKRKLLQWICHPGFSSRDTVSETSGRGVGMDVVKSALESLGGMLEIDSEVGVGTRFLLKAPLIVAIIKILLVECAGREVGLPITRVLRILDIEKKKIQLSGGEPLLLIDDEHVPLYSLNHLLWLPEQVEASSTVHLVICESQGSKIGLMVDRLSGQREAFIKALPSPLNRLQGVSGATIKGDGRILFIVDPNALFYDEKTFIEPEMEAG